MKQPTIEELTKILSDNAWNSPHHKETAEQIHALYNPAMKPLSELANDEESCRKVWSYIFPSTYAKLERFYSQDSCVIFTGDNGDMVPDESRLELFFDGSFYCCIYRRNQEIDEGIGNIFGFVDLIRSLGYQPTPQTK